MTTTSSSNTPLYVSDPEKWLSETVQGVDLLCLVIFCGSWCQYDQNYLRKLGKYHCSSMQNVKLVAWTSQGSEAAAQADQEWRLTADLGFTAVLGDETNQLAQYFKYDEILPGLITIESDQARKLVQQSKQMLSKEKSSTIDNVSNKNIANDDNDDDDLYPNGMVPPSMLLYAHHGDIVLQWTKKFDDYNNINLKSLADRPDPVELFNQVMKRKHALERGDAVMPVHGSEIKLCTNDNDAVSSNCNLL